VSASRSSLPVFVLRVTTVVIALSFLGCYVGLASKRQTSPAPAANRIPPSPTPPGNVVSSTITAGGSDPTQTMAGPGYYQASPATPPTVLSSSKFAGPLIAPHQLSLLGGSAAPMSPTVFSGSKSGRISIAPIELFPVIQAGTTALNPAKGKLSPTPEIKPESTPPPLTVLEPTPPAPAARP
jgi:hypothetical protein